MNDSTFRPALEFALQSALEHLHSLDAGPVCATVTLEELRSRLVRYLPDESIAPEQVLRELVEDTRGGIIGSAGGRFFAWAVGGSGSGSFGRGLAHFGVGSKRRALRQRAGGGDC